VTRIIGCGNLDRGDDGVGIYVADRLREYGIPAETSTGEATGLMEAWRGAADVLIVDAVCTGAPAGTLHQWDVRHSRFPARSSASTHGIGLAEGIELARKLGTLPKRLQVYGIEIGQCVAGTDLSPDVRASADKLLQQVIGTYSPQRL
jgi:hydrogenase maturation protease